MSSALPQSFRLPRYVLIGIIATAFAWQCIGAVQDSQTTDEAVHLGSGRAYWQLGAFQLNPEHPSLFKLWAALPLALLPNTAIDTETPEWQSQNQWTIGSEYLYTSQTAHQYGPPIILFLGRFPMILIWLGLVVTMAFVTWREWGQWPAVAATALLAYDPTFLAHGHIVTNDVFTAFALFGVSYVTLQLVRQPSWSRVWLFAAVFGVAVLTKFSILVIWCIVPLLLAVGTVYHRRFTWSWWWRAMMFCVLVSAVCIPAAYGFKFTKGVDDATTGVLWSQRQEIVSRGLDTVPPFTRLFVRLADPQTITGKIIDRLQFVPLPGYWYWHGFFSAASHNAYGHAGFLLGKISDGGWWYYFPVALAVKMPLPLLFSVIVGLTMLIVHLFRKARSATWSEVLPLEAWFFLLPPLFFLVWSMTSHINIGIRHILPTYVFAPLLAAWVLSRYQQLWRWLTLPILSITVSILSILIATLAWPNTFGYFNALAGGTQQGHHVLLDSNLDWNQDYYRLQHFLRSQNFTEVHLALFGSIPRENFFPDALNVPDDRAITSGVRPSGIVVISAGIAYDPHLDFRWLDAYQPRWRVGSSIMVYDFR